MSELIQHILAANMQAAKESRDGHAPDIKRLKGLNDLAKRVARAEARGWFTEEGCLVPAPEQLVEVRRFHSDQLAGLKEVGVSFSMEALPVSIGYLYGDKTTRPLFGFVNPSQNMRDIVPVAREVAVSPEQIFIPGGENLPFEDQRQKNRDYGQQLKKKDLRTGTLDGVDFDIDHTSIYAQLDFAYQRRFNGRKLIVGGFARTIDETSVDLEFGPGLAVVGRRFNGNLLGVRGWDARLGRPGVRVVSVATPAGNR